MSQSIRGFARQSCSCRRTPVCLQERCGIRIVRGPEYARLRDLGSQIQSPLQPFDLARQQECQLSC